MKGPWKYWAGGAELYLALRNLERQVGYDPALERGAEPFQMLWGERIQAALRLLSAATDEDG